MFWQLLIEVFDGDLVRRYREPDTVSKIAFARAINIQSFEISDRRLATVIEDQLDIITRAIGLFDGICDRSKSKTIRCVVDLSRHIGLANTVLRAMIES